MLFVERNAQRNSQLQIATGICMSMIFQMLAIVYLKIVNQVCHVFTGHAQQAEPNNGRLEIDLEGVCLQLDTFKPHGSPYAWRLAFSIHQLEVHFPPFASACQRHCQRILFMMLFHCCTK